MNKNNQTELSLNILKLFHLDKNLKKKNAIPFPINKIKSSISSMLFIKEKNSKNKNHRLQNLNNKKVFHTNKTKNLYSKKYNDLIKSNKYKPKSNKKNFSSKKKTKNNVNKINNINKININNNINIINHLESNPYDYLINSPNSVKKKGNSYSVKDQKKEKEINCLKFNSNINTNSISVNANKNIKIKSDINMNINIEDMQINNQKLKTKIDEISLQNKTLNKKIKQLRNKNLDLKKLLYVIKKERDDYSQSINQSLKLLKSLKENGLELSEIMENLSNLDDEEEEDEDEEDYEYNIQKIKNFENDILSLKEKDTERENEESDLSNVSFGRLDCNDEINTKKIPIGIKSIPKLKMHNINKIN